MKWKTERQTLKRDKASASHKEPFHVLVNTDVQTLWSRQQHFGWTIWEHWMKNYHGGFVLELNWRTELRSWEEDLMEWDDEENEGNPCFWVCTTCTHSYKGLNTIRSVKSAWVKWLLVKKPSPLMKRSDSFSLNDWTNQDCLTPVKC